VSVSKSGGRSALEKLAFMLSQDRFVAKQYNIYFLYYFISYLFICMLFFMQINGFLSLYVCICVKYVRCWLACCRCRCRAPARAPPAPRPRRPPPSRRRRPPGHILFLCTHYRSLYLISNILILQVSCGN
jgi:hypothetical protein